MFSRQLFVITIGLLCINLVARASVMEVKLSHTEIVPGETFWVHVKTDPESDPKGFKVQFDDQIINMVPHPKYGKHHYLALVGVPIEHELGKVDLRISADAQSDMLNTQPINIVEGNYTSEEIKVSKQYTELPRKIKQRVEEEWLLVNAFYKSIEENDHTIPRLKIPLESSMTSPFGTHRVFNGTVQSYHSGIDLRAPQGTPVPAAQSGRVLFTSDLYYAGKHVVIDHGGGILTTYSHLSDIQVKPGETIEVGEIIGYSGATGRVSGPHLHWVTKVHKVTVNPIQLKSLLDELNS